jgi:hypothetical protein
MRRTLGFSKVAALLLGLLALLAQTSFASIELRGTLPPGTKPLVILKAPSQGTLTGLLKFKFSAPGSGAYSLNFCVGPETNPCGLSTSYVVTVPAGEERFAVIDAHMLTNNVLVVAQGTRVPVPFAVSME